MQHQIQSLRSELFVERHPTSAIQTPQVEVEPIGRTRKSWSSVQADMERIERETHPDAKEKYWRDYIARIEERMKQDAGQERETVSVDESSSSGEIERIGSERGSGERISEQDES